MELIIAGFHRSGTSFTTQMLNQAGMFVGSDLMGVDRSNPYGHFEDREVVGLHDEILRSNGKTWQIDGPLIPAVTGQQWDELQRIVSTRRQLNLFWGFKDPRVCHFLGLWKHVMPEAKVLAVYRHYGACVRSLHRRHGEQLYRKKGPPEVHRRFFEEPDLGLRMWLHHNKALVREAKRRPEHTMVVSFERLAEGFPLVSRLTERWGLPLDSDVVDNYDPAATTNVQSIPTLDDDLVDEADQTLTMLKELHAA